MIEGHLGKASVNNIIQIGHFTKDGAIFMLKNMRANGMLKEEISETE